MIREKYALLNQYHKRCKMIKHVQHDLSIDVRFKFGAATECGGEEATLTIADPKKFPSEISTQHFAQGKLARGGAGFAQKVLIEAFNSTEKLGVIKRCGSWKRSRLKPYTSIHHKCLLVEHQWIQSGAAYFSRILHLATAVSLEPSVTEKLGRIVIDQARKSAQRSENGWTCLWKWEIYSTKPIWIPLICSLLGNWSFTSGFWGTVIFYKPTYLLANYIQAACCLGVPFSFWHCVPSPATYPGIVWSAELFGCQGSSESESSSQPQNSGGKSVSVATSYLEGYGILDIYIYIRCYIVIVCFSFSRFMFGSV